MLKDSFTSFGSEVIDSKLRVVIKFIESTEADINADYVISTTSSNKTLNDS